jgi:hypothetical protein
MKGLLIAAAFALTALAAFWLGRWWENSRYLSPHRDDVVLEHFLERALEEIAQDPRHRKQTKAVYRRSKIVTLRVAGMSCLIFLPRSDESEWTREVCFTDEGQLVKNEAH